MSKRKLHYRDESTSSGDAKIAAGLDDDAKDTTEKIIETDFGETKKTNEALANVNKHFLEKIKKAVSLDTAHSGKLRLHDLCAANIRHGYTHPQCISPDDGDYIGIVDPVTHYCAKMGSDSVGFREIIPEEYNKLSAETKRRYSWQVGELPGTQNFCGYVVHNILPDDWRKYYERDRITESFTKWNKKTHFISEASIETPVLSANPGALSHALIPNKYLHTGPHKRIYYRSRKRYRPS